MRRVNKMAKKGSNTIVVEAKDNLVNTVNQCIQMGVPAVMVSIMLENVLNDLNTNVKKVLEMEQEEYDKQVEVENQQVEYVPEEENGLEQNEVVD